MCGDFAEPFDAGVFHGDVRVEAFGDGLGDESRALFMKQLDKPLLFRDKRIDLRRLAVKEGSDGMLFMNSRQRKRHVPEDSCIN
jgi:hypothetical protein